MSLHRFVDIRTFRVKLPEPLFPLQGQEAIQVCDLSQLPADSTLWLAIDELRDYFPAPFSEKNPLNMPGPIYGAETDTCCTGPQEAPDNVLLDRNGQEFVCRQAGNALEFRNLLSAALCECFEGYGANGDAQWRLSTIRQWWRDREDMIREPVPEQHCKAETIQQWHHALRGGAKDYLRIYAFFAEIGRPPTPKDPLPEID